MNDYEKAIAEFMAKQKPITGPPIKTKAEHKTARRETWDRTKPAKRFN